MKSKSIWFLTLFLPLLSCSWISCSLTPSSVGPFDCDFDHDLCGWHVVGGGSANNSWHRTIEPKQAWLTTSQLDRSLNNQFQYLASKAALKPNRIYCLSFRYYIRAVDEKSSISVLRSTSADLPAVLLEGPEFRNIWKASVERNGLAWTRHYLRIAPPQKDYFHSMLELTDFYLMFIGRLESDHTSIGLDDIRLFEGDCPVVDENLCDFEVNTCGWQLNGTEVLSNYVDHTTGGAITGHLVGGMGNHETNYYWGSMSRPLSTLTGIFRNNDPPEQQQICIQFYHHIGMDFVADEPVERNASILVKVKNVGHENALIGNISVLDEYYSYCLQKWCMFRVNFQASQTAIIEIESLHTDPSTQLYIDDIRFVAGQCETGGNCDFETDMCGWEALQIVNKYTWLKIEANSDYIQGGHLEQDHTTRTPTGNYVLYPLEMIDHTTSATTSLLSPLLRNDNNKADKICFTMWYFVQTRDIQIEAIEVKLTDIRKRKNTAIHATGTHALEWRQFSVQFNNLPERFQIQIRVLNAGNILSNVGIDDIRIVQGDC